MFALRDLQRHFAHAVLTQDGSELLPWLRGSQGEVRIQLYVQTVRGILVNALLAVYPVTQRLLGQRCFDGLAKHYIDNNPSHSGDLHEYGEQFADFILRTPLANDFPYLADVAHLEWCYHRIFHAANHNLLDLQRLQRIDPACYSQLRFTLTPACRLFTSPYPVHSIWQVNQPSCDGSVTLLHQLTYLLLLRSTDDIEFIVLSAGDYTFLTSLQSALTLTEAIAQALAVDPDFNPNDSLLQYVTRGVLIDFIQNVA